MVKISLIYKDIKHEYILKTRNEKVEHTPEGKGENQHKDVSLLISAKVIVAHRIPKIQCARPTSCPHSLWKQVAKVDGGKFLKMCSLYGDIRKQVAERQFIIYKDNYTIIAYCVASE